MKDSEIDTLFYYKTGCPCVGGSCTGVLEKSDVILQKRTFYNTLCQNSSNTLSVELWDGTRFVDSLQSNAFKMETSISGANTIVTLKVGMTIP